MTSAGNQRRRRLLNEKVEVIVVICLTTVPSTPALQWQFPELIIADSCGIRKQFVAYRSAGLVQTLVNISPSMLYTAVNFDEKNDGGNAE